MASAAAVPAAVPDGTAGGRIGNVSPRAGRRPRRSARCGETYPTIQAAIDFIAAEQTANNDGTLWRVLVRAGTYDRFDVPLRTKNITIEGESRENVIVRVLQADDDTFWGASHDSGGITLRGTDITLKNLTIQAARGR